MDTKTPLTIKLSAGIDTEFLQPTEDQPRRFKGVANSGRAFGNGSYQMAVDFANLTYKPKTAVLVEHNGHMVAGVCTLSVTAEGLIAEGELLDNEYGNMVANASDREFPWEMSAYVQAARGAGRRCQAVGQRTRGGRARADYARLHHPRSVVYACRCGRQHIRRGFEQRHAI